MRFLFWNLQKKPLADLISLVAREQACDVLMFAECDSPLDVIIDALAAAGAGDFEQPARAVTELGFIYRRGCLRFHAIVDAPLQHFAMFHVDSELSGSVLLYLVHLPSKLYKNERSQLGLAGRFKRRLLMDEKAARTKRTVVVGDFNMDPFEGGLSDSEALHAVHSVAIAKQLTRTVDRKRRRFFFNPMWSLYADGRGSSPPGSYYARRSDTTCHFWHMFDQVIVRPRLIDALSDVRLLQSVNERSLLRGGVQPDPDVASDHLPLVFSLNI